VRSTECDCVSSEDANVEERVQMLISSKVLCFLREQPFSKPDGSAGVLHCLNPVKRKLDP